MKRTLGVILLLSILTVFVTCVHALEIVDSGNCGAEGDLSEELGENVKWELDNQGTLTIRGRGDMYTYGSIANSEVRNNIKKVIVEDGVTSISSAAFHSCSNLESVAIADSITKIETQAFRNCDNLVDVKLPNNLDTIKEHVFYDCDKLETIDLPNSILHIEREAFYSCDALSNIAFSENLTDIGYRAFYDCDKMIAINLPNSLCAIDGEAFFSCSSLTDINLPEQLTQIGFDIFSNTAFAQNDDNWENDLLYWGNYLLQSKYAPEYTIKEGTILMADAIFIRNSQVEKVTLPSTLISIGVNSFDHCTSLKTINISNGVKSIGDNALSYCSSLEKIIIPDSVTSIGAYVFYNSHNLNEVILPDTIEQIGSNAFSNTGISSDEKNWQGGALYYGPYLLESEPTCTECEIKEGTRLIANGAFDVYNWVYDWYGVKRVSIPESVTIIGKNSFSECNNLTDIYFAGSEADWKKIEIGSGNEQLNAATIHYNSSDFSLPTITSATVATSGEGYIFNISIKDVYNKCHLITALYDNDMLVWVKITEISADNIPDTIIVTADSADSAKVFLWDSLNGMKPLCEAVDAEFQ